VAAARLEREIRVERAVRALRDFYGGDHNALASLRYLLGRAGFEPELSRAEIANLYAVSVEAVRYHEPRASCDLEERLRGIA
jgi:hypothetical protein